MRRTLAAAAEHPTAGSGAAPTEAGVERPAPGEIPRIVPGVSDAPATDPDQMELF